MNVAQIVSAVRNSQVSHGVQSSMSSTISASEQNTSASGSRELKALAVVLHEEFDVPFRFYESATGDPVVVSAPAPAAPEAAVEERGIAVELAAAQLPKVIVLSGSRYLVGFPLDGIGPSHMVAVGIIGALARSPAATEQEHSRLSKWARSVHERLRRAREMCDRRRSQADQDRQSMIAWEAIMILERLHCNLQIHKDPARNRGRILRAAGELLGASSLAWVSLVGDGDVVIEGERLLSPWDLRKIVDQLADRKVRDPSGYVLINEARQTGWGARFPRIANLLAVPVTEKSLSGWMLAVNKREAAGAGPKGHEHGEPGQQPILPFRRRDAALLLPFASLLSLHARAYQRYLYIKDVLVGLTRSLTAAIDAKDEYTYGHSERVARAAVELARELGLRESEQNDIYLAGLLHDIGKIGIRDEILTKRELLTELEIKHIQQHPVIGHRILAGLQAIAHLLPGVLYHHERYDGRGYPEGLSGDSIPLLARILAVADSFDAINTTRPYRSALAPECVDQILREGAGGQWDPLVIDAYFRCRDRLIAIRQRGLGESLRDALDGAIRNGMGRGDLASVEMSIREHPIAIVSS
jgi:HD-GYP domain-containing protein (c-di-GMP phosphodiesterase class II)